MINGIESRVSSGRMLGVERSKHQRHEQQRPETPVMVDAIDQLDRHPEGSGADEEPEEEEQTSSSIKIVLARLFHSWERRLHAVSKDRVVRPFEWGLDWIETNGHSPGAPSAAILLEWASRAVADSDRFFATPDTSDYNFSPMRKDRRARSHSRARSHAVPREQRRARALLQGEHRRAEAPRAPKAVGAVVVLPQWNAGPDGHVGLCRLLNRFGISALRLTLPYHDARRPAALARADYIVSANVAARRRRAARP